MLTSVHDRQKSKEELIDAWEARHVTPDTPPVVPKRNGPDGGLENLIDYFCYADGAVREQTANGLSGACWDNFADPTYRPRGPAPRSFYTSIRFGLYVSCLYWSERRRLAYEALGEARTKAIQRHGDERALRELRASVEAFNNCEARLAEAEAERTRRMIQDGIIEDPAKKAERERSEQYSRQWKEDWERRVGAIAAGAGAPSVPTAPVAEPEADVVSQPMHCVLRSVDPSAVVSQ